MYKFFLKKFYILFKNKGKDCNLKKNKEIGFYIDIINGVKGVGDSLFLDHPEALRRGLKVGYAFDMIEAMGDIDVASTLHKYLDVDIDDNSIIVSSCLGCLGSVSDSRSEKIVYSFLESKNCDSSFHALCALSNMLVRNVLSDSMKLQVINFLSKKLKGLNSSIEELLECAITLKKINYNQVDMLISLAKDKYPEFEVEYSGLTKYD